MRKRVITRVPAPSAASAEEDWLNPDAIEEVQVSSEDPAHPIESALMPGDSAGWRAAGPGRQTISLVFARPQRLRRIRLHFVENQAERTQQYVLRWSPDGGKSFRDIVRQQWNFSPNGATRETEDHRVDLPAVTVLELDLNPDIGGGDAIASLVRWQLA